MKWLLLSLSHLIIFGLGFTLGVISYPTITESESVLINSKVSSSETPSRGEAIQMEHVVPLDQTPSS